MLWPPSPAPIHYAYHLFACLNSCLKSDLPTSPLFVLRSQVKFMGLRCLPGGWCLWIQCRSPRALTFIRRPPSPISSIHLGSLASCSHGVRSKVSCGGKQTVWGGSALSVLLRACNKNFFKYVCFSFLIITHFCHYY